MKLLNKYLRGREWLVDQYNRNRNIEDHIKHEDENINLADKISFRLLATRDHPDYEWLKKILAESKAL